MNNNTNQKDSGSRENKDKENTAAGSADRDNRSGKMDDEKSENGGKK